MDTIEGALPANLTGIHGMIGPEVTGPGPAAVRVTGTAPVTVDGPRISPEVAVRLMFRAGGGEVQGIARDMPDNGRFEESVRRSERLETLGRMASGIAHDFNNQLTVVRGYAQFLLAALAEGDPARRDAMRIDETVQRASRLVAQLIAFSRQQPAETQAVNLTALVGGVAPLLRLALGERVTLRLQLAPDLWEVRADPGQIDQVLMNLVQDASDAMLSGGRAGGALTIETVNVEIGDDAPRGLEGNLAHGPYVMLVVSDTGCGMTAEVRERIFEPFFTTKEPGKGTGLGLSIVHGIVKECGGHIACESEPGRGTTFRIYLARAQQVSRAIAEPTLDAGPGATPSLPRGAVLVVEHDDGAREVFREAFARCGCEVRVAAGVESALAAATGAGPIDLLVTDVSIPDGGGRALVEYLARLHRGMSVIYTSADPGHGDAVPEVPPQAAYLAKPFGPCDLLRKAHELLADRASHPPCACATGA